MSDELPFFLTDDGYTPTAYIGPDFPMKKGFWISYRFPDSEDRDAWQNDLNLAVRGIDEKDSEKIAAAKAIKSCEAILKRLVGWEFEGVDKANTPEPSIENIRRFPPYQFRRLIDICVFGIDGGDPDPRKEEKERPKSPNEKRVTNQGN